MNKRILLTLKTSVDRWQSRSWRSQQREIFRSEAGDRDQNMFTNELPDRFYLQCSAALLNLLISS
jgi:hypothetical protein